VGSQRDDIAAPTTTASPTFPTCTEAEKAEQARTVVRSYSPTEPLPTPGDMPAGSTMATIQARGRLIVGVSGDTLLFGARNPLTGAIEGFDIDILKEVAKAIFGEGGEDKIEYKVITYADRLPRLEAGPDDGGVDIVAHTMTINCNRWLRIAFSSEYFTAGQKVLVKKGSGFTSIDDLDAAGARVCAPEGSTNIDEISNKEAYPGLVVVGKPDITDCLVGMQQGEIDAATGDDTVLAGFAAQDPNTEVPSGDAFTDEPYGLGIGRDNVDLVRFVNGVLEEVRESGRWTEIYQQWLIDSGALQPPIPDPPLALYGREDG
jgi:polar amino acid transport system substrate-binding protein